MIYLRNFFSGSLIPHPQEWPAILIPLADKTSQWFSSNWPVIQNGFQVAFAVKELKWDRKKCAAVGDGHYIFYGLLRARVHKAEYFGTHGYIVLVAGALGMFAEFYKIRRAQQLSRITVLFANAVAFKFHVELLLETDERVRKSAMMGLFSNLTNIASSSLLIANREQAALFFGTLGVIAQTTKGIFETAMDV